MALIHSSNFITNNHAGIVWIFYLTDKLWDCFGSHRFTHFLTFLQIRWVEWIHTNSVPSVDGNCVMYTHVHFSVRQARVTSCTQWLAYIMYISVSGMRLSLLAPSDLLTFQCVVGFVHSVTCLHFCIHDSRCHRLELNWFAYVARDPPVMTSQWSCDGKSGRNCTENPSDFLSSFFSNRKSQHLSEYLRKNHFIVSGQIYPHSRLLYNACLLQCFDLLILFVIKFFNLCVRWWYNDTTKYFSYVLHPKIEIIFMRPIINSLPTCLKYLLFWFLGGTSDRMFTSERCQGRGSTKGNLFTAFFILT